VSNTVLVRANGPLILRGEIVVEDTNGDVLLEDNEAYLCRCGQSKNKPFCDGEHKHCAFSDNTQFQDDKAESLSTVSSGKLTVSVRENAMLIFKGPMTIQSEYGSSRTTRTKAAICRCGLSKNKPFCDTSHKKN